MLHSLRFGSYFQESEIAGSAGVDGGEEVWGEPVEKCMHCFKNYPLSKIVAHNRICTVDVLGSRERFKNFIPSVHDVRYAGLFVASMIINVRMLLNYVHVI